MTTSSYMVDVKVQIAFNAGVQTPAASRTWTDVSTYVELDQGLTIVIGRQDERSTADANHLTLVFINDGRFTPFKTTGAYYPNVLLNRPIWVQGTPVDGAVQDEFLGFIDEWPITWTDGTDGTAYAMVTASSRLSRLGTQAAIKSIVETAILTDLPTAYYTMGEPAGSVAANDTSGNRATTLTLAGDPSLPVVFGTATGPGTDGLTAATFVGGQYLSGGGVTLASGSTWSCEWYFSITPPSTVMGMLGAYDTSGTRRLAVAVGGGPLQVEFNGAAGVIVSSRSYTDALTHHMALTQSGTTLTLYVDGIADGTATVAALGSPITQLNAGQIFVGSLAHVAFYSTTLSPTQVLTHANAGLTGYAGDTTSARLIRYAGYAGIETAAVSAETGQTTVQHIDTTDKQPVELMRVMETTEGGVLFDNRDGVLTLQNRAHRLSLSSSFTLDFAQHQVESDYLPKLDRTAIFNDITAQDTSGRYTAHVFDAQSRNTDNGVATLSIETASQDDDEPLFLASWALYKYKQPLVRIPSLTVNCLAQVGKTPNCATVLAANVGSKITVNNRPAQDGSSSASFFVEGYTRVYNRESCFTTFNLSPSSPEDTTYICGDASRGVIGTNPIAL
jgi:hypothetical protein